MYMYIHIYNVWYMDCLVHVLLHAMCVSAELAGSCLRSPFRQLLERGSLPEKREIVSFAVYT